MKRYVATVVLALVCGCSGLAGAQVVLYQEDFDDGVADDFVFTDDVWWVEGGYLQCSLEGYEVSSMAWVPGPAWTDYMYDVDLRVFGSINHLVRFRIQNEGDFYEVNLRAYPYADALLQKYVDGEMTILDYVEISTQPEEWHHFAIAVSGSEIAVDLDYSPLLEHTDNSDPHLWGGVGAACYTGGTIHWQDLDVDNVMVIEPVVPTDDTTWGAIKGLFR